MSKTAKNEATQNEATQPEKSAEVQKLEADVAALRSVRPVARQLMEARIKHAEHACTRYIAHTPIGDTMDDILNPAYFAHMYRRLRVMDEIRVVPDDNSFDALVTVRAVGQNSVVVAVLRHTTFEPVQYASASSEYRIDHGGNYEQFRVLRGNDVLRSQFPTRDAAEHWLKQHLKAL